jgi:hypothetical protein
MVWAIVILMSFLLGETALSAVGIDFRTAFFFEMTAARRQIPMASRQSNPTAGPVCPV